MADVIDFKDKKRDQKRARRSERRAVARTRVARSGQYLTLATRFVGKGLLHGIYAIGRMVRFTVFIVMYILRRPVTLLLNLGGIGCLFGTILFAFIDHSASNISFLLTMGTCAIGLMALSWFYDSLLLALSPRPLILM